MGYSWGNWLDGGNAPTANHYRNPTDGYEQTPGAIPKVPNVRQPRTDGDGHKGLGTNASGKWYDKIPGNAFNEFISEPNSDWFRREWAGANKKGVTTEESLQRFSPVPRYWLAALGLDGHSRDSRRGSPQNQADTMGKFYDRLMGPEAGKIDPRKIMQKVIGSTWNKETTGKNDYIANLIANPELDAPTQVSNFWSFVNGTVGRVMPPESMNSYKKLINRESVMFQDYMVKNPTAKITFNKWIEHRLGSTGGI